MRFVIRHLAYILCVILIASSVGCARYQERKNEYLQAQDEPPLRLPPDLSRVNISDYYNIPEVPGEPGEVSIEPPID